MSAVFLRRVIFFPVISYHFGHWKQNSFHTVIVVVMEMWIASCSLRAWAAQKMVISTSSVPTRKQ